MAFLKHSILQGILKHIRNINYTFFKQQCSAAHTRPKAKQRKIARHPAIRLQLDIRAVLNNKRGNIKKIKLQNMTSKCVWEAFKSHNVSMEKMLFSESYVS